MEGSFHIVQGGELLPLLGAGNNNVAREGIQIVGVVGLSQF